MNNRLVVEAIKQLETAKTVRTDGTFVVYDGQKDWSCV
jgi:hypothetical protein